MYLLDTDIVSLLLRGNAQVTGRVLATPFDQIWVSSVTVEEMLRGSLDVINAERSRPTVGIGPAYERLLELVQALAKFNLLAHDQGAEALFRSWSASVRRIGAQDCRIAASAISQGFILVTRNERDFRRIPGVQLVNWAR